jgi:hypothetical protein
MRFDEHDETMPAAQELARKAREQGWEVELHHDTIDLQRGGDWIDVVYDDGRPVEVRVLAGSVGFEGLLAVVERSVDEFLAAIGGERAELRTAIAPGVHEAMRWLADLPPVPEADGIKPILRRLLG